VLLDDVVGDVGQEHRQLREGGRPVGIVGRGLDGQLREHHRRGGQRRPRRRDRLMALGAMGGGGGVELRGNRHGRRR